ncbi:MAG: sulfotransferase [Chloroflexi bacterium]|nr:sulfotransferase [Chloroflexota bacterium]
MPYHWLDKYRYLLEGFRRYPLQNGRSVGIRPFFIIGSGRSGNTLLRAMLTTHDDLSIPPESYVLGAVVREYNRYSFLPWHILSRLVISRFESHHQFHAWEISLRSVYQSALDLQPDQRTLAHLLDLIYRVYSAQKRPSAQRWGDKTPSNTLRLDELELVFPQAQYIHMIRDGRDVVSSYLQAGIYREIEQAAHRWRVSVERGRQLGRKIGDGRYMEVRYEALVADPEAELRGVCLFLDIEFQSDMLDFWQTADQLGDANLPHHANVKNPINLASIGRWRENLTAVEQELVQQLLGPTLDALGYA